MTFDVMEREYIHKNGWYINSAGMLELTAAQAAKEPYLGRSVWEPNRRTLMIPSIHGCSLLFEGQHFIIKD